MRTRLVARARFHIKIVKIWRVRTTFWRWGRKNVHETAARARFHMSTTSSSSSWPHKNVKNWLFFSPLFHVNSFISFIQLIHSFQFVSSRSFQFMEIYSFQFLHFNSFVSIYSFQFIHFNSLMSIHSFQFIHVNSFMSIHSSQFIRFNSCVSIPSFQVIHVTWFMSIHSFHVFHFISIGQLTMHSYKPFSLFETSAPARAGHYLIVMNSD